MKRGFQTHFSYSVFYEQAAEGGYVASVPTLPGCHTQGETLEEAERNVKEPSRYTWKAWRITGSRFRRRGHL